MLKILGGSLRSRMLQAPPGHVTRPMGARTKEAIFNVLRGWFDGTRVLDLFAGAGTMGIEAASRGAGRVVCVEQERQVFDFLRANIAILGIGDRVDAVQADALGPGVIGLAPAPVDVVFMDPPFEVARTPEGMARITEQCARLRAVMAPKSFLVLRLPDLPGDAGLAIAGFSGPEIRSYGREQHVLLYMPCADDRDPATPGSER
ncbi:MAG: methyltransferase [Phycisphaerales bacterium]|nr:methyltransferase [Phycisphaerales bacterium]